VNPNLGKTLAFVSECIGDRWFVNVNRYSAHPDINPQQVWETFSTREDAVAWAESFLPDEIRIQEGGRPYYETEYRFAHAND